MHTQNNSPTEVDSGLERKGEKHWGTLSCHICTHKHNSQAEIDSGLGRNGERHWSLPVIHAHTRYNSPTEVDNEFGGKGKRHWSLNPVINANRKQNSRSEDWEEKRESIGHFQSYMDTQNNSPSEVDGGIGRKRGEALVT